MSNPAPFQPEPPYVSPHDGGYQQPLEYSNFGRRGKPGILTAVGIISIVLGAFGALASLSTIAQGVMFGLVGPRMTTRTAVAPPPPPPVPVAAAPVPATPARVVSPESVRAEGDVNAAPVETPPVAVESKPGDPAPAPAGATAPSPPAATDGRVIVVTPPATAPAGAPAAATPVATATVTNPFVFSFDRRTIVVMFFEGGIGLALAVFLLVLGILTLRGSPRGRRGHVVWAWLKLPAAALTGVYTAMYTQAMFESMTTLTGPGGVTPPANFTGPMAVVQSVFAAAIACIYPVSILIVMRTKRVREYYDAGAGAALQ